MERVIPFSRMRSANLAIETNGASFQASKVHKPDAQPKTISEEVLLTFALVPTQNPNDSSINQNLTAFFDSGSSFSFIDKEVAQNMKLPIIHRANIAISVFGQSDLPQSNEYIMYQLTLS